MGDSINRPHEKFLKYHNDACVAKPFKAAGEPDELQREDSGDILFFNDQEIRKLDTGKDEMWMKEMQQLTNDLEA